jgi:hypothetical protein
MRFAFDLNHQSEKIKISDQRKPVGFIFHESGHCCVVRLTFIHKALVYAHLLGKPFGFSLRPVRIIIGNSFNQLRPSARQALEPEFSDTGFAQQINHY